MTDHYKMKGFSKINRREEMAFRSTLKSIFQQKQQACIYEYIGLQKLNPKFTCRSVWLSHIFKYKLEDLIWVMVEFFSFGLIRVGTLIRAASLVAPSSG